MSIDNLMQRYNVYFASPNILWLSSTLLNHYMLRINFAGFPAHIWFAGTGFVTTLPAPIMLFSPMVTPFKMMHFAPMKTLSPITTGAHFFCFWSSLDALTIGSREWKSVVNTKVPPPF